MIKQFIFSFCLILLLISTLNAQQTKISVSGTVKSFEDGSTLPFVTVAIKGTTEGIKTDFDGKYILKNVSPGDTLVFSFIGYQTQKIGVNNLGVINVSLHATAR